jgi:chromosome partitioning protein
MAQTHNRMHQENIEKLPKKYPAFLKTIIPFTVEVEKMGLHRKPILASAKNLAVAAAYWTLCDEIEARMSGRP